MCGALAYAPMHVTCFSSGWLSFLPLKDIVLAACATCVANACQLALPSLADVGEEKAMLLKDSQESLAIKQYWCKGRKGRLCGSSLIMQFANTGSKASAAMHDIEMLHGKRL